MCRKQKLTVSGVLLLLLRAGKMCSVPKPIIIIIIIIIIIMSKQTFQVER